MTKYRALTDEEKHRYERVLEEERQKMVILEWELDSAVAMLERGIDAHVITLRRKYDLARKNLNKDIAEGVFVIRDAEEKLSKGVEIKDGVE